MCTKHNGKKKSSRALWKQYQMQRIKPPATTWLYFFICVKTNVGYSVVGEFITQAETAEQISEALQQLRLWNPKWSPRFFMTDYSRG